MGNECPECQHATVFRVNTADGKLREECLNGCGYEKVIENQRYTVIQVHIERRKNEN